MRPVGSHNMNVQAPFERCFEVNRLENERRRTVMLGFSEGTKQGY